MSNVKSKVSHRLLAAFLSMVMVFSMIPCSMLAHAATTTHPDAVTVTVVDDVTGEPIEGAKVTYAIYDNDLGEEVMGDDDVPTDANGEAVIFADSEPGNIKVSSITVTHDDYATYTNDAYDQAITSLQDNFTIEMTCTKIKDVDISGKTLTYNGESQKLVSVTEVEGDTVEYYLNGATDPVTEAPIATDAGTYSVRVVVTRVGKTPLDRTVETVITPADIEGIDIAPVTGLKYNEANQALVTLTGSFAAGDVVTWTVNGTDENASTIPERMAVGAYTVKLTVDRGANYNKFEKTVNIDIALGEIDLGDLKIEAKDRTYDTTEQPLLTVTKGGDYTIEYSDDNQATWDKDSIPVATNAGEYVIYVKATKEGYNDKNTPAFPITVTIEKAPQSLEFAADAPSKVTLGTNNEYNFAATGENLSGNDIGYSLEERSATDVATITDDGMVTVANAGIVTVKAFRTGNENYLDAVVYNTIIVKNASTELVTFDSNSENYVLDEDGIASEKVAIKAHANDNGTLTYSIDKTNIGLSIDSVTGKVTVNNEWKLAQAMGRNGSVLVTVTVSKTEGSLNGVKWVFENNTWDDQDINEKVFAADTDTYTIQITYAAAPSFNDVCKIEDADPVSGWYNVTYPATITPLDATTYTIALDEVHWNSFGDSVTIEDQGTETHYVYLKNKNTKQISAAIAVNVKVDTVKPAANRIKVEYAKSAMDEFLEVITLGFYKPSVTVRFTAYDVTSGIDYFTWNYTKENGASTINHPDSVTDQKVDAVQDNVDSTKFTGEFTITADEYNQYRGYLSVTATDNANNTSDVKKDSGNVFVIDTVSPQMSIKYEGAEPYTSEIDAIGTVHYFDGNVAVELTITEANFYSEDVTVAVTRDGQPYDYGTVSWGSRNAEDKTVGAFTLAGDGDYVVTVTATDKSGNAMVPYTSETITVDNTDPVINVEHDQTPSVQKTTITVIEHNFRIEDVVSTLTAKDIKNNPFTPKDLAAELAKPENWKQDTTNPDKYAFEYSDYLNGLYELTLNYTDISGRQAAEKSKSFTVDHGAPTDIKIEYAKSPLDAFLEVITLGFYNPSVTIRFTAYDSSAGVASFVWGYVKEQTASTINHPEKLSDKVIEKKDIVQDGDKFTATITLAASEFEQYRGSINVVAIDAFGNKSDIFVDNGNVIVVDTVTPYISVVYPVDANRVDVNNKINYYNKDIQVKFIVTEANFYPDEMQVLITKDGQPIDFDTNDISWGERDSVDKTIGTFTLDAPADHSKDGDYVITVNYKDRSSNEMATYVSETYTIDTIKPVINVNYANEDVVNTLKDSYNHDRNYFKADQTAQVSITEHNFNAEDVELKVTAVDVTGQEVTVDDYSAYAKVKENWVHIGDTYTLNTEGMLFDVDANYTFNITYSDMATNQTEYDRVDYFTVDKTAPELVSVKYRKSALDEFLEVITLGFYQAPVEVELVVSDNTSEVHEFDYKCIVTDNASSVNKGLEGKNVEDADGVTIKKDSKKFATYFTIPEDVLTAVNQFDGKIDFIATNRSGVAYSYSGNTQIVVDNIAPTAQVSYNEATNVVGDISYYNGDITATITVTEANFYSEDVKVMVSKDGGVATAVTPTWKDNSVDEHVGTFTLTEDGDYIVTINYTDKSSNSMTTYTSKQLTIDTKIEAPTYTINDKAKTEVGGAYKGDAKIGFNFADQNFDTKTIKLTRTRFDKVEDVTETFVKVTDNDKGGSGNFTIPTEVGNDGIYVLRIAMTDKAKHQTESEIKFTINRYGSVYEYSDELVELIKDGGQYIKSVDDDLVITEYNADRILEGSLQILITRDGETVDVDFTSNPENINAQVGIGESGWYQYVYTVKASNFEKDGVYKISLTSKYAADDSAENESTSVPENSIDEQGKEILDTMNFTVDSVAPEIRNIVNLDKKIADKDKIVDGKLNVKYTIVDVGGLKTIEIIVNGETVQTLTAEDIADNAYNFTGDFDLAEQNGTNAHKVQIKVTDLAGNVADTNSEDFLKAHSEDNENSTYVFFNEVTVSRNFFVRWYANTGLFWGSIAGVVVLAGGIWFIIAAKKKKKEEEGK